ncbi:dihydroorotate dehydrogenase electron transfer subunit [Candidatus Woesearchaeota archaeon]|nr:dihydroorotate dehydrogenase electron transfer subunit [Candidatus Woesearchaeota archaeon]
MTIIQRTDIPKTVQIVDIIKHNNDVITISLGGSLNILPGQFIFVWLPNIEEKPFAVVNVEKHLFSFTAVKRGVFTSALFNLKKGMWLGYRGPYGKGFTPVKNKNVCIIAGGIGMAALCLLYNQLIKDNNVKLIYGAKNKEGLVFKQNICNDHLCLCTDDGSEGRKAFTTQLFEEILLKEKFDFVYTCGPEIMMKQVADLCAKHNIPCEASLERMMSCGFGVCGKCAINNQLVCLDGPVFNAQQLTQLKEFGTCKCD